MGGGQQTAQSAIRFKDCTPFLIGRSAKAQTKCKNSSFALAAPPRLPPCHRPRMLITRYEAKIQHLLTRVKGTNEGLANEPKIAFDVGET